jgi:hypothetical protein
MVRTWSGRSETSGNVRTQHALLEVTEFAVGTS